MAGYSGETSRANTNVAENSKKYKETLADRFLVLNQEDLPEGRIPQIREALLECSVKRLNAFQKMNCRKVHNMQFISLILGWAGVDRMLLGDFGMGLLKLLTLGGFGLIMLYDWFTVAGRTRNYNYTKIIGFMDCDISNGIDN